MQYQTDQINDLIHNRRSVKPASFNSQPVDDGIIHQMLENARWAPTHGLTEPWHFTVFSGAGRNKFAEFTSQLYKKTSNENFIENKFQKLLTMPLKASHLIVIGMVRQLNGKIPEIEEICSVACAVQNMQLTATAYGVGCYWSTGAMTYRDEMKSLLNLHPQDKCLGILYVGCYDNIPEPTPRKEMSEKSVWVRES